MYLLLGVAMSAAALSGPAGGDDRNVCEVDWQAAHASGTPLNHDRFIAACLKGAPAVTAQIALPDPPRSDVTVPGVSDAVPSSLSTMSTCGYGLAANAQTAAGPGYDTLRASTLGQACTGPGGLPQGVR